MLADATIVDDGPPDSEWEDVSDEDEDNEESRAAIDRILQNMKRRRLSMRRQMADSRLVTRGRSKRRWMSGNEGIIR